MKFLTLAAINLVVLGAIWFRIEPSEDSQVQSPSITHGVSYEADHSSSLASSVIEIPGIEFSKASDFEDSETRESLLEEYWQLLLGDDRDYWCPSRLVDRFHEKRFIMSLGPEEGLEYLGALMDFEERLPGENQFISLLLNQVAAQQPREALAFMLESGEFFNPSDYQSVVRFWMDNEDGVPLDWFEKSGLLKGNGIISEAFHSVYAEEDPFALLVQFGDSSTSEINEAAATLLCEEFGASVFENLKQARLSENVLGAAYLGIGKGLLEQDPAGFRDWIQANQYSVDPGTSKQLVHAMIGFHHETTVGVALDNLEWGLSRGILSPNDEEVQKVVRDLGWQVGKSAKETLERVQANTGADLEPLLSALSDLRLSDKDMMNRSAGFGVPVFTCGFGRSYTETPRDNIDQLVASLREDPILDGNL